MVVVGDRTSSQSGGLLHPGHYGCRCAGLEKFYLNRRWNQNATVKFPKDIGFFNENQIIQWRRVGYDDHAAVIVRSLCSASI